MIGICTAVERSQFGVWDAEAFLLHHTYIEAVQRAGGAAVMLPPDPDVDADQLLDVLDGLILAGGRDIDPATYGAERANGTDDPRTERDEFELALAQRAMERDIPLLGICRGMQLMNIARGGTLVQSLPEHLHRRSVGTFDGNDHPVRLEESSLAARATGEVSHDTLSHHHQGIDRVGDGLRVTARAETDGTVEAVEDNERRFMLGVLWHPEEDEADRLIAAFVEECRTRTSDVSVR